MTPANQKRKRKPTEGVRVVYKFLPEAKNGCCPGLPVYIWGGVHNEAPAYFARCSCGAMATPWKDSVEDAEATWQRLTRYVLRWG